MHFGMASIFMQMRMGMEFMVIHMILNFRELQQLLNIILVSRPVQIGKISIFLWLGVDLLDLVFITMVRQGIQVKRLMVMQFRMR